MRSARSAAASAGSVLAALALAPIAAAESTGPLAYESEVVGEAAPRSSASARNLSPDELDLLPRRDAEDLLRAVPGLELVQHGSEGKGRQFLLRGFDAGHGADFEVTVDGIPINEWSNVHGQGYVDLNFLVPEAIRALEVTKGPFALAQGPFAVAGSADFRTGIPVDRQGLRVDYTAGSMGRHRGALTWAGPAGRFLAAEGLLDEGFGENRDIRRGAILGRWEIGDVSEGGAVHALAAAHVARFGLPGALRDDEVRAGSRGFYDAADPIGRGRSDRLLGGVGWTRRSAATDTRALVYGGLRSLEVNENFTFFFLDPVRGDRRLQRERSGQAGLRAAHRIRLGERMRLETVGGVRVERLWQAERKVSDEGVELERQRELSALQSLSHLAAGIRLEANRHLELRGGARLDLALVDAEDHLTGERANGQAVALSPRFGATWRLAPAWRLLAAYGRGVRPPEARAFLADRSPPMVQVDSAELGLRFRPSRALAIGAYVFGSHVQREAIYDHLSGLVLELGASRRLGGEVELDLRPMPGLRLLADLAWVDARFVESGRPVPYVPRLGAGLSTLARAPFGTEAGLRLHYLAPRPLPHGARSASRLDLDLRAAHAVGMFEIALEVENLLGLDRREGEYVFSSRRDPGQADGALPALHFSPAPPRHARLTISVRLW